jgi:hypothetical protein
MIDMIIRKPIKFKCWCYIPNADVYLVIVFCTGPSLCTSTLFLSTTDKVSSHISLTQHTSIIATYKTQHNP